MPRAEITLEFPSVGATENILLAAVKADGDTRILGAAREPEVTALCEFLTACGATDRRNRRNGTIGSW